MRALGRSIFKPNRKLIPDTLDLIIYINQFVNKRFSLAKIIVIITTKIHINMYYVIVYTFVFLFLYSFFLFFLEANWSLIVKFLFSSN